MGDAPALRWLAVGCGGFVGAILRHAVTALATRSSALVGLPLGTLIVNVAGCVAIGLLAGAAETRSLLGETSRAFVLVGLLGGFTTYSTFGLDAVTLVGDGERARALLYVALHLVLGLGGAWGAYTLARSWA